MQGVFALAENAVYSDYKDSTIGSIRVSGLVSCWMGLARDHIAHNLKLINDKLDDPDAIEILSKTTGKNLECKGNSMVWDSRDETEALYPREPEPNTVNGQRRGQCVLASAATEGGQPGPGPCPSVLSQKSGECLPDTWFPPTFDGGAVRTRRT